MTQSADIPEAVLRFIAEKIDSVPQLEALLLFAADEQKAWTCEELAARIYVTPAVCNEVLNALERRRLIASTDASRSAFRYNPTWDAGGYLMQQLVASYRRSLVPITLFIHSRGSSAVRDFARAFDLKKER